jgi:hypothetical protein
MNEMDPFYARDLYPELDIKLHRFPHLICELAICEMQPVEALGHHREKEYAHYHQLYQLTFHLTTFHRTIMLYLCLNQAPLQTQACHYPTFVLLYHLCRN